jgi:hypothetical protein
MLGESEHHSRSTIEIDVEQIAFCVGYELRNERYRKLRLAFLRTKAASKWLCCSGRFYNFLQSFAMP